ncbi:pyridoxamine 5'-phosphate oxidase family protein [Streptomyces sp. NBC_01255]|uniref:pyridoxamine 5'-phosphate oxidase family protein n=1 Tax=Streptomyces sp. NBC_01255 TaxID=2903798 RepID=UPI002E3158D4|nr:pyridoxamine 5'-phosphate oxidase family protein [Streptomyces sp. NBC_01255]
MTITRIPRGSGERKQDVVARLEKELDIWVASADAEGEPYLVPLSFLWDGEFVWLCTRSANPTGRNLLAGGRVRLALGDLRDVVLVDGEVTTFSTIDVPTPAVEAFLAKTGWDPRISGPAYGWFRVRPRAVQAWHEEHELPGRHIMRDGVWAV